MSLTINSPHKSLAGGSTLAGFGAVNVTVRSALTFADRFREISVESGRYVY